MKHTELRLTRATALFASALLIPAVAVVPAAAAAASPQTSAFAAASATADCSADPNARLDSVPSPEDALGTPLGLGQAEPVTVDQIQAYVAAIDAASDRVVSGTVATSNGGEEMPYAIVSKSANVTKPALDKIARQIRELRDPRALNDAKAAEYADELPAIAWIAGNVHGGEKSGADAALKTLYELSSGLSCDVENRLDNLITVIMPTQNPDGRNANRRQNDFGFDLNRDWFARTQVETDAKLELLRAFPPQVFIDAHEMGGRQYFFPPNADPIHHEIADQPVDWINRIGAENAETFTENYNGICTDTVTTECYFNYRSYDMFYMGYGDTVPATGFGAAGMTYEKGSASATEDRVQQQFLTQWATTGWAAGNRHEILSSWYQIWKTALAEGEAGTLEPNEVVQPTNTVQFPVPDLTVRSYFLLPDRQLGDVRELVDRLRRMDVEVYEVQKPLTLDSARLFGGRDASEVTVPAGSYWIPMAQPQKHWIQATLGEDPYVPFPYFYDVSSWSNPLLAGMNALSTGDEVTPKAKRVTDTSGGIANTAKKGEAYAYPLDSSKAADLTFALLGEGAELQRTADGLVVVPPSAMRSVDLDRLARSFGISLTNTTAPTDASPLGVPDVGLFGGTGISLTAGSHGETRFVLGERWGLDLAPVTTADINDNTAAFTDRDVLVVPDGSNATGGLTATGQANLKAWVEDGGVYLGFRNEGTRVARSAGLTSTTERAKPAGYQVVGSHFRVDTDASSAIGLGRPDEDFAFNNGDPILEPSTTGTNVVTYPTGDTFWTNGYSVGADALRGSAAVVDEPVGSGHAVLYAFNPLFRAYNDSGMQLVANALLMPAGETAASSNRATAAREAAQAAPVAADLGGEWRPISITVAPNDAKKVAALVAEYDDDATRATAGGSTVFTIANPDGLSADEHPFLRELVQRIHDAGVTPQAIVG